MLLNLLGMTIKEIAAHINTGGDSLEGIVSVRYVPGTEVVPGSRIDLVCSTCGMRVALDATSQRLTAEVPLILCNVCYAQLQALTKAEDLVPQSHEDRERRVAEIKAPS